MTNQTHNTEATTATRKGNPPTHVAKVRKGFGKNATYERIGVAWVKEDGSLYVKLNGTQVVSGFALYALPPAEGRDGAQADSA